MKELETVILKMVDFVMLLMHNHENRKTSLRSSQNLVPVCRIKSILFTLADMNEIHFLLFVYEHLLH